MMHWLNHSLVVSSDYRIPDPDRVAPLLERRQDMLAELGAHHVLVYTSTSDPERVMVIMAIHTRDTVLELLRSRVFFDWFDAVGVEDIPALFAGEVVDSVDLVGETNPSAPETMVSVVTPIEDITALIAHIHATLDDLRAAGVRNLLVFSAFDNPHEAMMVFRIDDESHARHWLRDTDLSSEWLGKAGIGAYPPVFVGRLRRVLQIAERDSTGGS
ncbi:hypothetical protein ABIA65_002845 [Mycolicibacterium sp. 624]